MSAEPSALPGNTNVLSSCEVGEGGAVSSTCEDNPSSRRCSGSEGSGVPYVEEVTGDAGERSLPQVLTVEELADFLRVNHKTVRDAIGRAEIPGVRRLGTTIRISRDAVLAWLSSGQGRVSRSKRFR